MDVLGAIVRFFQQGGLFMYPILIVFALGLAIAVERWMYLTMSGASNRALWNKIVPFLKAGNFQEAATVTARPCRSPVRPGTDSRSSAAGCGPKPWRPTRAEHW